MDGILTSLESVRKPRLVVRLQTSPIMDRFTHQSMIQLATFSYFISFESIVHYSSTPVSF